ncbi:MAG: hydrogenase 4 subunit B [Thermodesulfovibrionales bacterium]
MDPEWFVKFGVFLLLLASILSVLPVPVKRKYLYIASFFGSASFGLAGFLFSSGAPWGAGPVAITPFLEFAFSADPLSGFFVVLVSVLAACVSVYSIGYSEAAGGRALMGFLYNLFLLSIYAVALSANIVTFLIAWESMSVVSYFLVTFDKDAASARAGLVYAVMTHIGTAFITAAFLLLYAASGSMDFAGMKAALSGAPAGLKHLAFVFSAVGFGVKAGVIPLHTWLPLAHPAAPSNVSALMSGVMIKTGIYGFLRISMDVLGGGPEWWGVSVLVAGAVSSVLGILYALMERDMKRLLAFSSVENVGIILLGIGASMVFGAHGLSALSALALTAALYHALNHSLFKGLLFLGAGSVVHAMHTKDLEKMGGLLKAMPYTGLFFLVGSVSICALPPFNGFLSEWLTFQSLLRGFEAPSVTAKIISPLGGAALAMTGALAAACFVKAFGIPFLGAPRSEEAARAREASPSMVAGMAALAVLCLAVGVLPSVATGLLTPAVEGLTGSPASFGRAGMLGIKGSSVAPLWIAAFLLGGAAAAFVLLRGRGRVAYGESWDCGIPALTPRMQYTATGFTKPLVTIFKRIYLPRREISFTYSLKPFFVKAAHYRGEITPFVEKYLHEPVTGFFHRVARKARLLQSGSLHLYLGYILIALVLLLIFGA